MKNSAPYAAIKHQDSYGQHRGGLRGRMCAGNPPRCSSLSLVLFARLPLPTLPLIASLSRWQLTLFSPFNPRPGCRSGES